MLINNIYIDNIDVVGVYAIVLCLYFNVFVVDANFVDFADDGGLFLL